MKADTRVFGEIDIAEEKITALNRELLVSRICRNLR